MDSPRRCHLGDRDPAMNMRMRVLSNIAFPALYQSLFSYFLVIGFVGKPLSGSCGPLIILAAAIGIPLTARFNFRKLAKGTQRSFLLILHLMLAALIVPLIQLALFLSMPR